MAVYLPKLPLTWTKGCMAIFWFTSRFTTSLCSWNRGLSWFMQGWVSTLDLSIEPCEWNLALILIIRFSSIKCFGRSLWYCRKQTDDVPWSYCTHRFPAPIRQCFHHALSIGSSQVPNPPATHRYHRKVTLFYFSSSWVCWAHQLLCIRFLWYRCLKGWLPDRPTS